MRTDLDLANICECISLPELNLHHPDRGWETRGDIQGDPETDADTYATGGYDEWFIGCPECGRVYSRGGNQ